VVQPVRKKIKTKLTTTSVGVNPDDNVRTREVNMRKLASIQRIKNIEPIEGADAIEKASVLGWQLVIRKGDFAIDDLCVYCEIDSVMPDKPEFEFVRAKSNRIKTIRLRGQISQGICFPLNVLPEGIQVEEDLDVTDILGVTKFEPPIPANLAGEVKGMFPSFIPKTDETRVQVLQKVLDKYEGIACYVTEKLDGSSATFYFKDGEFGVCSRNLDLLFDESNSMWKFAVENKLEEKLKQLGSNIALQGEIIGEGIQKNKYKLKGQHVHFFNVFAIDSYSYLSLKEAKQLLNDLELKMVPVLEEGYMLESDIEKLIAKSKMRSVLHADTIAEGIVIRPVEEMTDKYSLQGRVSFKAINPDFLIKYDE
jgi:RNA ligase (TIGR02306 family)